MLGQRTRIPSASSSRTDLQSRVVVRCLNRKRGLQCVASTGQASSKFEPQVCVVLGTQWGDEGKGKLVDILAQQYDVIARAQVCRSPTRLVTASLHGLLASAPLSSFEHELNAYVALMELAAPEAIAKQKPRKSANMLDQLVLSFGPRAGWCECRPYDLRRQGYQVCLAPGS